MTSTHTSTFATALIILFLIPFTYAQTYTTLANGTWNNTTNVWSTDGITPCGCTPGASTAGNDIVINHNITTSYNLIFNGGSNITLNLSGSLLGGNNINMWNSTADFFGNANLGRISTGVAANFNLHTGAILLLSNQLTITDGVFTNDGGLTQTGGIDIGNAGTLICINSSKMTVTSGNLTNYGAISICASCCVSSNGNWRNMATGNVIGSGSVFSGGNINNSGIWDVNIVWCSTGGDIGMVSPEDCATSTGICGAIVLPVELGDFIATAEDNKRVVLDWETISESNSSHFAIERSHDGENWIEIGTVDAAGNSFDPIRYFFTDYSPAIGENYYRLVQFDLDDRSTNSNTVSARIEGNAPIAFPNPIATGATLTIRGLQSGDEVSVLNASGRTVIQEAVNSLTGEIELNTFGLVPGMYFIQAGSNEIVKLIVTR